MSRTRTLCLLFAAPAALGCPSSPRQAAPCDGVSCSDRGTCEAFASSPYCQCSPGYHPLGLACVENDAEEPCRGVTCAGHGTCAVLGLPRCECEPGFELDDSGLLCLGSAQHGPDAGPDSDPPPPDPYGSIDVDFSSSYILDGTMVEHDDYVAAHPSAISRSPAFTGAFGGAWGTTLSIPGESSGFSRSHAVYASHYPSREGDAPHVFVLQESWLEDYQGTGDRFPLDPWVRMFVNPDAIEEGRVEVQPGGRISVEVIDLFPLSLGFCVDAVAMGGQVEVTEALDTTSAEGGRIAIVGRDLLLYHPTETPMGDLSAAYAANDIYICQRE